MNHLKRTCLALSRSDGHHIGRCPRSVCAAARWSAAPAVWRATPFPVGRAGRVPTSADRPHPASADGEPRSAAGERAEPSTARALALVCQVSVAQRGAWRKDPAAEGATCPETSATH